MCVDEGKGTTSYYQRQSYDFLKENWTDVWGEEKRLRTATTAPLYYFTFLFYWIATSESTCSHLDYPLYNTYWTDVFFPSSPSLSLLSFGFKNWRGPPPTAIIFFSLFFFYYRSTWVDYFSCPVENSNWLRQEKVKWKKKKRMERKEKKRIEEGMHL